MSQDFPWYENRVTSSRLKRFFIAARPLLLVSLIASAYAFTPLGDTPVQGQPQSASGTPSTTGTAAGEGADPESFLPTESLFASLFGADAVDPLFALPEIISPGTNVPVQASRYSEPTEEPARSVYRYLIAASDIGFEANQSKLGLALATADQGEPDALSALIVGLETKHVTYATLTPPAELAAQHAASVAVLERYIALLRAARDKRDGSVQTTWDSPEREAIASEAGRITKEIRDIVHNFGITLPAGVLP